MQQRRSVGSLRRDGQLSDRDGNMQDIKMVISTHDLNRFARILKESQIFLSNSNNVERGHLLNTRIIHILTNNYRLNLFVHFYVYILKK